MTADSSSADSSSADGSSAERSATDARDLLAVLLHNKVISAGQAEVARSDEKITGMSIDEALLVRGWVTEETLSRLAPWLATQRPTEPASDDVSVTGDKSYQENLKEYRRLMAEILGEAD